MYRRTTAAMIVLALGVASGAAQVARGIIFDKESLYHRVMVSEPGDGYRYLLFNRARGTQSAVKLSDPTYLKLAYTRTIFVGLAFQPKFQRVLFVGLGGGSMPKFLRKHYPDVEIDVVDVDPVVVEAAKKYFLFAEDPKLKVTERDGRVFLRRTDRKYGLIFLDAYNDDFIPFHLTTREFLESVKAHLEPGGAVVTNLWCEEGNRYFQAQVKTYQAVFAEVYHFDVPTSGNRVLVATAEKGRKTVTDLATQAEAIMKDKQFDFDLVQEVKKNYSYYTDHKMRGDVLTDDHAPVNMLRQQDAND